MRRRLLILLLAILPVQFGWASVVQYDGHEVAPAQAGFEGSEAETTKHTPMPADGCDPGDADCHAPLLTPALASTNLGLLPEGNAYPPRLEQVAWGRSEPAIDRPKWSRAR